MSTETIYPYGVGGQTPSGIGLNMGSFAEAYDLARENNYVFGWLLSDVDDEGNEITKMIWHTGNRKFVDAIGAEINGTKNGLTIECSENCYLKTSRSNTRLPMYAGENNFSFDELGFDQSYPVESTAVSLTVYADSTGDSTNFEAVTGIDFGGMIIAAGNSAYSQSFKNAEYIKRLVLGGIGTASTNIFRNINKCRFLQVATYTTFNVNYFYNAFANSSYLKKADFRGFDIRTTTNTNGLKLFAEGDSTPVLEEIDIRDIHTKDAVTFKISSSTALKKLIIGDLDNTNMTSKIGLGCTNAVLICTTSTPPKLKNCAFDNGVEQDEYSNTYDWVAGHFSAIYVPTSAVTTYQEDVYVENGTIGNTGWSVYADIIHDIAEYDG